MHRPKGQNNLIIHRSMGARSGNKFSSHSSEDSISCDSLSFAGLVSQDQQQKSPSSTNQNKHHYQQVTKQDPDFEFSTIKPDFNNSATSPFRITPADVLISNGQIKPHAIVCQQSRRPFVAKNAPMSLRSLLAVEDIRSININQTRKYHEQQLAKTRIHKSKEKTTETRSTWFGQKVFRSFLSPCRKCQAVQPDAVKVPTVKG